MPEQEKHVIEQLFFNNCQQLNTERCPNLQSPQMQLSIINARYWFMLNDEAVEILAEMCKECATFIRKHYKHNNQQENKL